MGYVVKIGYGIQKSAEIFAGEAPRFRPKYPPNFGQNTPSILAKIPSRFRQTFTYIFALPLSHIFTGQREIEYFLIYFYYIKFQEHSTRRVL